MAVANPDFSAYVQRAKDINPESIFIFVPGGAQPAALGKAFAERGVDPSKIKIMGTGEVTDESALKNMGDAARRHHHGWHYDYNHDSALNREFVKGYNEANPGPKPNFFAVGGYDGMHLIYEALKKTNGNTDGAGADERRQGHDVGKPARHDPDRSGDARHHPDRLHPARPERRRQPGQCRVRQGAGREGPGKSQE